MTYLVVMSLACLSFVSAAVGVTLALRIQHNPSLIGLGIGFSAGIMLPISLLELLPEAIDEVGVQTAALGALFGGALFWALNFILPHTHLLHERGGVFEGRTGSAYLIVFGLILHDIPEGFAMANSYVASPALGLLVGVAILLHNVPEELAIAIPIVPLGRKRLLYRAALLSALAEPAGALAGLLAVGRFSGLNEFFMAFAAGAMVFVSLHELLPMARRYGSPTLLLMGVAVGALAYLSLSRLIAF